MTNTLVEWGRTKTLAFGFCSKNLSTTLIDISVLPPLGL